MAEDKDIKKGTGLELLTNIWKEAGIEPDDIPHMRVFCDPRGSWWNQGECTPVHPELFVLCMFYDEGTDDVRIYCVPIAAKDAKGRPTTLTRFTLSRVSNSLIAESISGLELFKDLIKDELLGAPDPEPEATPAAANGAAAAPAVSTSSATSS